MKRDFVLQNEYKGCFNGAFSEIVGKQIFPKLADMGTILLTFMTRCKMGILQRVVNQFHKAYDAS